MEDFYLQQIDEYTGKRRQEQKKYNRVGNIKLLLFIIILALVYPIYQHGFGSFYGVTMLILLVILLGLFLYQAKLKQLLQHYDSILKISNQYLQRIRGEWATFADCGEEFADPEHDFALDLDLVGPKSLFQMINLSGTWHGRNALAQDLLHAAYTPAEIETRQQAIAELAAKQAFACRFQSTTEKIEANRQIENILIQLNDGIPFSKSPLLRFILLWLPLATVACLVLAFAFSIQPLYLPASILLGVQSFVWLLGSLKTRRYLSPALTAPLIFGSYTDAMRLIKKQNFSSTLLQEIARQFGDSETGALAATAKLESIISKTHLSSNGLLYILMNMLFLWDYRCVYQLSAWKAKYASAAPAWFARLGEFESLLSFSCLVNVCATTCLPQIATEAKVMEATALGHPLLANSSRVCNDIAMQDNIWIISGSNMSGKTTFLRTVGINLVLAKAGGPVCAQTMRCLLFRIISSMRIADDLQDGISSFYAELRRIKRIVEAARQHSNLFFLIDEIFRGTNSEDRLYGACTVIRELSEQGSMGIVTSHDLKICDLAQETANILNYSFCEHYKGDEMFFDYQLNPGKSSTTNAKFLMRQVGILP